MSREKITRGSGNVFADLGIPDPEQAMSKANCALQIKRAIHGLTQKEAAEKLGVDQAKVSAIVNGRLYGFSLQRLLQIAARLGYKGRIDNPPVAVQRPGSRCLRDVALVRSDRAYICRSKSGPHRQIKIRKSFKQKIQVHENDFRIDYRFGADEKEVQARDYCGTQA